MNHQTVDVICLHTSQGTMTPLFIVWNNGIKYKIDKILQCCQTVSLKSGNSGTRYTCLFNQECRYLFYNDNRWFIEAR